VPVRLSVLLPYLSYLMKPLVLALESSTELVAQGLRTLELCIDNLTAEFLNPLMAPVIDDVFAALWKLLRPVPAGNPHYSHQTLRILGKLGGKNRKITDHSKLKWRSVEEEAKMLVRFEGKEQAIKMVPVVELAVRVLKRGDIHYREVSFNFLKYAATTFLNRPASTSLQEETFSLVLRGLMESVKAQELASEATEYILGLTNYIFESELGREMPDGGFAKHFLPRSSVLLDAMTENLALASNDSLEDLRRATDQTKDILLGLLKSTRLDQDRAVPILRQFSSRLSTLCYDHLWHRKAGGACGMHVIASQLGLGPSTEWLQGHELEMVRALLFSLRTHHWTHRPLSVERWIPWSTFARTPEFRWTRRAIRYHLRPVSWLASWSSSYQVKSRSSEKLRSSASR
jgi:transformation/transcription domain-associated protein